MTGIRKRHTKEFKLKVVLAALAGDKPVAQIAQEHSVHPQQIKVWKDQAVEAAAERLGQKRGRKVKTDTDARLYEEIGRLKIELDFLSGKLGR